MSWVIYDIYNIYLIIYTLQFIYHGRLGSGSDCQHAVFIITHLSRQVCEPRYNDVMCTDAQSWNDADLYYAITPN